MKLLFDSWSSQVLYQQKAPKYPQTTDAPEPNEQRLNTLFGAIKSIGLSSNAAWNVAFTTPPITSQQLHGVDVYISLTRFRSGGFAYKDQELDAIEEWVHHGGNVLLMSNHGGLPDKPQINWTVHDAPLAALFGVKLLNYAVGNWNDPPHPSNVMKVQDAVPYIAHQAPTMTTHNSCVIDPKNAHSYTPIVCFPSSWTAYDPTTGKYSPPPTPYFALLVPGRTPKAGSLLVMGNSGWIGDYGSPHPACGLAPHESNLMFALNCIGYLGGLRKIPPSGKCPEPQ